MVISSCDRLKYFDKRFFIITSDFRSDFSLLTYDVFSI